MDGKGSGVGEPARTALAHGEPQDQRERQWDCPEQKAGLDTKCLGTCWTLPASLWDDQAFPIVPSPGRPPK